MPQMGHVPGPSRTICGCMGQVYWVRSVAVEGRVASSAIPHFGQAPGFAESTSGCMGQVYWADAAAFVSDTGAAACEPSNLPGSASNFVPHPAEQKYQVPPACSTDAAAFCGNTFMPHTGSILVRSATAMLYTCDSIRVSSGSEDSPPTARCPILRAFCEGVDTTNLDTHRRVSHPPFRGASPVFFVPRTPGRTWGTRRHPVVSAYPTRSSTTAVRCPAGSTSPRIGYGRVPRRRAIATASALRRPQSHRAPGHLR